MTQYQLIAKSQRRKTWQDYRNCKNLGTETAVQIQDKFNPVIQGTWRQGKITRNMKMCHFTSGMKTCFHALLPYLLHPNNVQTDSVFQEYCLSEDLNQWLITSTKSITGKKACFHSNKAITLENYIAKKKERANALTPGPKSAIKPVQQNMTKNKPIMAPLELSNKVPAR